MNDENEGPRPHESRPDRPESVVAVVVEESAGICDKPNNPTRVPVGFAEFPSAEVAELTREVEVAEELHAFAWPVRQPVIKAVIDWIQRYVPRSIEGDLSARLTGGMFEVRIDDTSLEPVDLVRINGRAFVPEVVEVVSDDRAESMTVAELLDWFGDHPGPSWRATTFDIERALADLPTMGAAEARRRAEERRERMKPRPTGRVPGTSWTGNPQ